MTVLFVITVIFSVSCLRYRPGEINYRNADASWHTLLTIKAYNETPVYEHLFLPLVNMGGADNKGIPWGAAVPDRKGNYYYTSFSPAGFFLPWLFFKIFSLSVCEKSLYLFASFLFGLSAVLWTFLLLKIYGDQKDCVPVIVLTGAVIYIFSPELLHGMGIVYWHQSVMQVTLLIQILAYNQMVQTQSRWAGAVFYVMAFLNPYIEWTGYVANIGFVIAQMYRERGCFGKACKKAAVLILLSIFSFGAFAFHYLLRIPASDFFQVLWARFNARSGAAVRLTDVFSGYLGAFLYAWLFLFLIAAWNIARYKKMEFRHTMPLFLLLFPVLENVVMKEHTMSYTYDRMKGVFAVSMVGCELVRQLVSETNRKKRAEAIVLFLLAAEAVLNCRSYMHDESYVWQADYRKDNEILADYINKKYPESVLATEHVSIRGYMNLLFDRSIHEYQNMDFIKKTAASMHKRYAVMIQIDSEQAWNMYALKGADVYDLQNGDLSFIEIENKQVRESKVRETSYCTADLTDQNWTGGISNKENMLLFAYEDKLLIQLLCGDRILCGEDVFFIDRVDFDEQWIHVYVNKDARICMYPAKIRIT